MRCNVLVDEGKLEEAVKSYRDSLAILEHLAASDRSNTGWQRDRSVSYERIGGVGKPGEALKSFREMLAITERLGRLRSQQYRLAARSLGALQQDRRRADGSGQARRGAQEPPG